MLRIKPFKTEKDKIKLRPLMKKRTIPKFPESVLMVGASGSGKTTLLMRLMTEKDFYKGYHDFVFLFSITAKMDAIFKKLKLEDTDIFSNEEDMIENLKIIFETQKETVEKIGVRKSPKILLIFEDLTSNKKLMRDQNFKSLWVMGRHMNIMVIAMIHKYKILPRTERLNAMNIIYFRGNNSEVEQLIDDFCPPGHSKKEFAQLVDFATNPDEESSHNFIYIANKDPFKTRHRKCFHTILTLDK